jgi:DNA-binding NtrC family response regulator
MVRAPLIAIADDDTAFANYLKTFLDARGYLARVYSHGEELLAAARLGELPDVVLLDVMMPGMDGIATLRSLKAAHAELQVIMLSGRDNAQTIVEALSHGAVNYVVKPDDPDGLGEIALETAIKQAIEKRQLVSEVAELRRQVSDDQALAFWANSDVMKSVATIVDRVADNDVTVLIRGESGVGKELVARAIHDGSPRRTRPFVKVNCAAVPDDLLESELFGHEKGAFTGAASLRVGKFEHADGGTLMLDEIGEMKPQMQGKLLHVLQDGDFSRLGSNKRVTADVRVLAATNRDLEAMLARSEFREDLYYRLKVIEINVPPLRDRQDEIPQLIEFFTAKYAKRYNRREPTLTPALIDALQNYSWPGNVRELENACERIAQTCTCGTVRAGCVSAGILFRASAHARAANLPSVVQTTDATAPVSLDDRLREVEADLIRWALKVSGGNKSRAAELLRIKRSTLGDRINRCGLGDTRTRRAGADASAGADTNSGVTA